MNERTAADGRLTPDELEWLAAVEAEWQGTTPGTWYPHATDDEWFQSALYVSTDPGETDRGFVNDDLRRMSETPGEQADSQRVIAITLLQRPRLADVDACDANTLFIANVHQYLPRLLTLARRLDAALAACEQQRSAADGNG